MDGMGGGFYDSPHQVEQTGVKTVRNITAKQLEGIGMSEASTIYVIDKAEVSNVILCGYVQEVRPTSAGVSMRLFDTTGSIDCSYWTNGPYEEQAAKQLREGQCIKALGSPKVFGGKKTVNVSAFREVSGNEFLAHLVAAMYQHLHNTGRLEEFAVKEEEQRSTEPRIQRDILEVYKNNQGEEGLDLDVVIKMMSGRYREDEIRRAVDELLADCHLYWVSDTAYKTTM